MVLDWDRQLIQDIWEYDSVSCIVDSPKPRKLFWIYYKWYRLFLARDVFLSCQQKFPKEIANIIAEYIAPCGNIEQYFPRKAWDPNFV